MPVSLTRKCSVVRPSLARVFADLRAARGPLSVNLMALPSRFASTCRTRTGSPMIAAGIAGSRSQRSSSPFWSALSDSGLQQILHQRADREGNRLELELARLDLREVEDVVEDREQRLGRRLDGRQAVALLGGQLAVERQLGHAEDAVHRRPDFVAHVGEELALGAAGFHRLVARADEVGVGGAQFGRARLDGLLELILVVQELQVALLNLAEHLVEAADQLADLVVAAVRLGAQVVAPLAGDGARDAGEPHQRHRDDALQPRRQRPGDADAPSSTRARMRTKAMARVRSFVEVGGDEDGADDLAIEPDRPRHLQACRRRTHAMACVRAHGRGVGQRRRRLPRPDAGSARSTVPSASRIAADMMCGFDRDHAERLGGGLARRRRSAPRCCCCRPRRRATPCRRSRRVPRAATRS